ncbi:MAG: hypothetical protein ABFC18_03480 [Rikenellaceae bacterium]
MREFTVTAACERVFTCSVSDTCPGGTTATITFDSNLITWDSTIITFDQT